MMNALFSAIFLGDFIYRISTAPSAGALLFGFGWAVGPLPFPQFKSCTCSTSPGDPARRPARGWPTRP